MPNFAIHDGARVLNVIVAEDQETAESVSGMSAIETEGSPWIGWTMESEGWRRPAPFASWTWDESVNDYVAPTPMPESSDEAGEYVWDEAELEWRLSPAPVLNPELGL